MIHVDKSAFRKEGREINVTFLRDCFNEDESRFIPDIATPEAFADYRKKVYLNRWLPLLLEEQSGHCCYCMRSVGMKSRINIEHVIPKACDEAAFNRYTADAPVLGRDVMPAQEFKKLPFRTQDDIESSPLMPHTIAHTNLLVACNGIRNTRPEWCCCNNLRHNDYLKPLMLVKGGESLVMYDVNGLMSIQPPEPSWKNILEELNSETYQEIRIVWRHIACNTSLTLNAIQQLQSLLDRINLFKEAFGMDNFLDIAENYQRYAGELKQDGNMFYWNLLMSYSWFFTYYKAQITP